MKVVISKVILILFLKISIERRNDIEDEIHPHYQWNNQHAKAMSYHRKSSEENDRYSSNHVFDVAYSANSIHKVAKRVTIMQPLNRDLFQRRWLYFW